MKTPGRANGQGEGPAARPGTMTRWAANLADSIDEVMVLRLMNGQRPAGYTGWERREAVRLLRQQERLSYRRIADRIGIDPGQVWRDLRRSGLVNQVNA